MLGFKQRQWVTELRSGKYKQGYGHLGDSEHGYCCLGVANDYFKLGINPAYVNLNLHKGFQNLGLKTGFGRFVFNGQPVKITCYGEQFASLADMNDFGLSFEDIALIIENYWYLIFEGAA